MTSASERFEEPVRATLARTLAIAIAGGVALALSWGSLARFPAAFTLMLWPALGGHFVELWYLNALRPGLPPHRALRLAARLVVWLAGGVLLGFAMRLTARGVGVPRGPWSTWWIAALGFVAVELVAHVGLLLARRPNALDGRG
jgi:hypothetical protein